MRDFIGYNTLDIIEEWANDNGLIGSEEELSERFDNEIMPLIIEEYSKDDKQAINEGFNNWSDSLCKDGQLHELQYNNYCYVGKYENLHTARY